MSSVVPDPALNDWVPMWQLAPQQFAYGTTLPSSPTDGQIAILVDSVTAPTWSWMFRYNAGSSSAYKWEFVGGAPARSDVVTQEGTSSGPVTDLATVGPTFGLPRAGEYDISFGAYTLSSIVNGGGLAVVVNASNNAEVTPRSFAITPVTTNGQSVAVQSMLTASVPMTLVMRYACLVTTAQTASFANRWLRALPRRVS